MKKHKVLFVAYQFPPLSVGGSYRPYKFVLQLKKLSSSIEPIILSLAPKSYKKVYSKPNLDQQAYQGVQDLGVKIYHCESESLHPKTRVGDFFSIYFNVFKGSEAKYWKKKFIPLFNEVVVKEEIELIYVTCPPFSIGNLVRKAARKLQLPYIVDMRDNWSLWLSQPHGSRLHYWLNRWVETKLYDQAEGVIAVTEEQLSDIKSMGDNIARKSYLIPNSFDLELLPKNSTSYSKTTSSLKIVYAGSFYFSESTHKILNQKWWKRKGHRKFYYWPITERWIYRSPYFFFQLIERIKVEYPEIELDITFIGNRENWLKPMIKEFHLENEVQLIDYLSKNELVKYYQNSDLLLVTSAKREGGKDSFIASKTYEYLQQGKMILGIVSEGAQKDFLNQSGAAIVIDADHLEEEKEKLLGFAKKEKVELQYNIDYLKNFSIQETTNRLEELFKSILKVH